MSDKKRFGDRVRERRQELRFNQAELARRAKVSRSKISELEADPSGDIYVDTFFRLADALKWNAQQAKNAYLGKDPNDSTDDRKKDLIYQATLEFLEKLKPVQP